MGQTTTLEGVVLRRWDSGESDRRVSFLSREMGKIYAVARGARKAASKFSGITEPLTFSKIELAAGRATNYITQAQPLGGGAHLRDNYKTLSVALAIAEILDATLHVGEPHPEAFDLCRIAIDALGDSNETLGVMCWSDLKLMEICGYSPQFSESVVSGELVKPRFARLAPESGGVLKASESSDEVRSFAVTAETLIALAKLQALEAPPSFLKKARDVAVAITPFLVEIVGHDLPARRAAISA